MDAHISSPLLQGCSDVHELLRSRSQDELIAFRFNGFTGRWTTNIFSIRKKLILKIHLTYRRTCERKIIDKNIAVNFMCSTTLWAFVLDVISGHADLSSCQR